VSVIETTTLDQDQPLLLEIKETLKSDTFAQNIIQKINANDQHIINQEKYSFSKDLLFKDSLLYIPSEELRVKILKIRHESLAAGHFGQAKTFELVSRDYWWPQMRDFINRYVSSCNCVRAKAPRHSPHGLLSPLPIPSGRWTDVTTDHITDLPPSSGFNAVQTFTCRATKQVHFVPCTKNVTAEEVADIFIKEIFRLHGMPKTIVSDRGTQFTAKFWKGFCDKLNIKVNLSTAYHPQTDGQSEMTNQILESYLRIFVNITQDNWVSLLPLAEFAYNNSLHSSTGFTPFYANYGHHPIFDPTSISQSSNVPLADSHVEHMSAILFDLKESIKIAQNNYKKYADAKRKPMEFNIDDKVWLNSKNLKTSRPCKKLDFKRFGPYRILEKVGNRSYKLDLPSSMQIWPVFHVSLLEPFHSEQFEGRDPIVPDAPIIEGETSQTMVEIMDSRYVGKQFQYLVRWNELTSNDTSWEANDSIKSHSNYPALTQQFHLLNPGKEKLRRRGRPRLQRSNATPMDETSGPRSELVSLGGDPVRNLTRHTVNPLLHLI